MKRGITLMEVLIAMFVLLIGLLGVFSLLPVAKSYMSDATKYDSVSAIGRNALHDLEVRKELMDPANWFAPAGNGNHLWVCPPSPMGHPSAWAVLPVPPQGVDTFNYQWSAQAAFADVPAFPFVLDPLGCAYPSNLSANSNLFPDQSAASATYAHDCGPAFFPPSGYSLDFVNNQFAAPALSRITVPRMKATASASSPTGVTITHDTFGPFCRPMSFSAASKIFQSVDDSLFNRPDDPTQRPISPLPVAGAASQFSTSQGDYSWFATIESYEVNWHPGFQSNGMLGAWGDILSDDDQDGLLNNSTEAGWISAASDPDIALWRIGGEQKFKASVVVVHKRNFQLQAFPASEIPPERMCYCDFLGAPLPIPAQFIVQPPSPDPGNIAPNVAGLGGGDVLLHVPASLSMSPEWLNVKPNQWLMISAFPDQRNNTNNPQSQGQIAKLAWFRISSVGEVTQGPSGFQRAVTLSGPDWNPYQFVDAVNGPANVVSAYCTIVDGVVGVFEATVEQGQ